MTSGASLHMSGKQPSQRLFFMNSRRVRHTRNTPRSIARILISEDNPSIRHIYSSLLPEHGFELINAPDGDGELTLNLARRTLPHLLITDLNKPGMDGHSLRMAMRADRRTATIPTLMVTAIDPWSDPKRQRLSPIDDYIVKPFAFEGLLYRLTTLLPLTSRDHDLLAERALRLPCDDHYHPVTGLVGMHRLAEELPARTAGRGWAALQVRLRNFNDLLHYYGRPGTDGLFSRLAALGRRVCGPDVLIAHAGFDPAIVLVGPAPAIDQAAAGIAAQLGSLRPRITDQSRPDAPAPQVTFTRTGEHLGYELELSKLRMAFRA